MVTDYGRFSNPFSPNPTFAQKREELLRGLAGRGWKVSGPLKVPHATSPDGDVRYWFKPQAIWYSVGNQHSLQGAHSISSDMREMTVEKLESLAGTIRGYERWVQS